MSSDPNPHEVWAVFEGERAMVKTDSCRPVIPEVLEVQRRMARIPYEKLEVLAGQLLNFFWKRVKSLPELWRCPMHLQLSQLALLLCRVNFFSKKVKLARGRVALDLSIPNLPISLGKPLAQLNKVFSGKGFDFGLNCFHLSHGFYAG